MGLLIGSRWLEVLLSGGWGQVSAQELVDDTSAARALLDNRRALGGFQRPWS